MCFKSGGKFNFLCAPRQAPKPKQIRRGVCRLCFKWEMKRKRSILHSCVCCEIQFESNSSYLRHCKTKAHRHKQLGAQNAAIMERQENRKLPVSASVSTPLIRPHQPQMSQPEALVDTQLVAQENAGNSEISDETFDDTFNSVEVQSDEQEFFPFPDEKFFLLYCYAHGIMRPKVTKI